MNTLMAKSTDPLSAKPGHQVRQEVLPGMLMWEHKNVTLRRFVKHLWRLARARDVVWDPKDLMPSLASPVLLSYYYFLCYRQKLELPDLFQWHLIWEPSPDSLEGRDNGETSEACIS